MNIIFNIMSFVMYVTIFSLIILVYKNKLNFKSGLLLSAFINLSVIMAKIFIYNQVYSTSLIDNFIENAISTLQLVLDTAKSEANVPLPAIDIIQIKNMYTVFFPSLLIIYSVVTTFIAFTIVKIFLKLFKQDTSAFYSLSDYKFSKSAFWILALTYLFSDLFKNPDISGAFQNINILLMFFASFCGLSYIDFRLKKRIKNTFLRVLIYFAIAGLFSTFILTLLIVIALCDTLFNLRKKNDEVENG